MLVEGPIKILYNELSFDLEFKIGSGLKFAVQKCFICKDKHIIWVCSKDHFVQYTTQKLCDSASCPTTLE